MTIIDAANHSADGIKFRRTEWINKKNFIERNGDHFIKHYPLDQERTVVLSVEDLLADDWEIYEEQSPMHKFIDDMFVENEFKILDADTKTIIRIYMAKAWLAAEQHFTTKATNI